jgi:hypothetical protein
MFLLDVAKVDPGYCICCNDNIRMLQGYVSSIVGVSDVCFKCFIWMLHILLWLYTYVCSVCFKYFRLMLQVFYLNVAEVDLDVAYVAKVIHEYFKCMFQIFHLFQIHVASVSFAYFKRRS